MIMTTAKYDMTGTNDIALLEAKVIREGGSLSLDEAGDQIKAKS
jgi:hypothetical protein